jgi:hypothetical protein
MSLDALGLRPSERATLDEVIAETRCPHCDGFPVGVEFSTGLRCEFCGWALEGTDRVELDADIDRDERVTR